MSQDEHSNGRWNEFFKNGPWVLADFMSERLQPCAEDSELLNGSPLRLKLQSVTKYAPEATSRKKPEKIARTKLADEPLKPR